MSVRRALVIGARSGAGVATAPHLLAEGGVAVDVTVPNDVDTSSGDS